MMRNPCFRFLVSIPAATVVPSDEDVFHEVVEVASVRIFVGILVGEGEAEAGDP
jgi:hypothetical protein